jgi:hypothetical protein
VRPIRGMLIFTLKFLVLDLSFVTVVIVGVVLLRLLLSKALQIKLIKTITKLKKELQYLGNNKRPLEKIRNKFNYRSKYRYPN